MRLRPPQLPKTPLLRLPNQHGDPCPVQGVSELIARQLRPYNLNIVHKPTGSLRKTLVHMNDPLPTQRRRIVVYRIPCSECPSAYVGQTGRQFATRTKEHQCAVWRQDENSFLALHCLTSDHAFAWTRASVVGNCSMKRIREFIEADVCEPVHDNRPVI